MNGTANAIRARRTGLRDLLDLVTFAFRVTRGRIVWVALVTLLVGLTEGISLVMLVPIAALAAPESTADIGSMPVLGGFLEGWQPSLAALLIAFVALVAFQAYASRARMIYMQKILHIARDDLRKEMFSTIGAARWSSIRAQSLGEINHILRDDTERTIGAIRSLLTIFQALSTVGIYLVLAALVSLPMALLALGVGGFLFALLYPIRRRATQHGHEMLNLYKAQNKVILDFISGLRLSKLFVAEAQQVGAYSHFLHDARRRVFSYLHIATLGTLGFQVGSAIFAATFVWVAVEVYTLDLARIAVLLVIFMRIAPRFNSLQDSAQTLLTSAPSYINYRERLTYYANAREPHSQILTAKTADHTPATPPLPEAPRLEKAIVVDSVRVQFAGTPSPALDDVSLRIPAGQITAIIGPSGGGKSTLADLLLGLTSPDSGQVMIDGTPLQPALWRAWRSTIASVPQDAFLMDASLADNLRFAAPQASEQDLWDALEAAHVADLVRSLPQGLETHARERGTRFSGGERQRIALARALLRNPQLLVLDEATSALDWENERHIVEAVSSLRGERTCIVIAHRPSLVACADYVIALSDGHVIEAGSVAELSTRHDSVLQQMLENAGGS